MQLPETFRDRHNRRCDQAFCRAVITTLRYKRRDFVLIMEDVVARGADPRDSTRPMTIHQVANGVRGLARMHSEYWGDRIATHPALGWVEPFVAFEGLEYAPLHIAHRTIG